MNVSGEGRKEGRKEERKERERERERERGQTLELKNKNH